MWLIYMCNMTHLFVFVLFVCVTWLKRLLPSHGYPLMTVGVGQHATPLVVLCVTWQIHVTRSYVWHDSFICVTWLIHMCDVNHMCDATLVVLCMTRHIHMCVVTHCCVWWDIVGSRVPPHNGWLGAARYAVGGPMHDVTNSYVWCDPFIRVMRLIRMRDMTHSYVWHDSFICVTWLIHSCDETHAWYVMSHTYECITSHTHMNESYPTHVPEACLTHTHSH